ncbi:MAG: sulfatase-like hydrolase/transferase [Opitutaceae bacterium]|nr:sulfatase-like hydrolase/transferase [Opitutaceae bacterium]
MNNHRLIAGGFLKRTPVRSGIWTNPVAFFVLVFLGMISAGTPSSAASGKQPNIVFILIDDLRWDDLSCMGNSVSKTPQIDRIAAEGVMFRSAFATSPLCSPSRANILTGLYTHAHGILDNTDRSAASHRLKTFPQELQKAGYETAFLGKWHMGNDSTPRPGFDSWTCLLGQGTSNDATMNVDGRVVKTKGYVTDMLSDRAVEYVKRPHKKPFLLFFAHKALHPETAQAADGKLSDPSASNFIPAERHRKLYSGIPIPRRPNMDDTLEGKPALRQEIPGLPPLSAATGSSDEAILGRLRMLAAVDESTGVLLKALEDTGQLDDTLIVVTGDEGYFYGEHGLSVERRLAYEESIRIPLLMRLPSIVKAGERRDQVVTTLDLAPTLLELGGATVPKTYQGHSLVPLLKQNGPELREAFLIEYYTDTVFPRVRNMGYQAVRTNDWKYIHYVDLKDADELYDMNRDPYEMRNLIGNAKLADRMKAKLIQVRAETGAPRRD